MLATTLTLAAADLIVVGNNPKFILNLGPVNLNVYVNVVAYPPAADPIRFYPVISLYGCTITTTSGQIVVGVPLERADRRLPVTIVSPEQIFFTNTTLRRNRITIQN